VRLSDDRQPAVFAVADTGIGIAPEHVELIFQEFAQVDSAVVCNSLRSRDRERGKGNCDTQH